MFDHVTIRVSDRSASERSTTRCSSRWASRRPTATGGSPNGTALEAGYRDNGPPGERPRYHPGYYAAYVFDPDGHNIEVVNHNR